MKTQTSPVFQKPKLFDYYRSSASYRVRIALNLKGIEYETCSINLLQGAQRNSDYKSINPQGLVPALVIDNQTITQSLAIMDYLENKYPEPALLPLDPLDRARVLELAHIVAMDIHPLNNSRVLNYLTNELKIVEDRKLQWYHHWIREGFEAFEQRLHHIRRQKHVSCGDSITIADICLIPQVYNALRFGFDMSEFVMIMNIYKSCMEIPAFQKAQPESHPDAN